LLAICGWDWYNDISNTASGGAMDRERMMKVAEEMRQQARLE
jgi:hypothetical protein